MAPWKKIINHAVVRQLADFISQITGSNLQVVENLAEGSHDYTYLGKMQPFPPCAVVMGEREGLRMCWKDCDGAYKRHSGSQPLIFTCHAGLTEMMVPLPLPGGTRYLTSMGGVLLTGNKPSVDHVPGVPRRDFAAKIAASPRLDKAALEGVLGLMQALVSLITHMTEVEKDLGLVDKHEEQTWAWVGSGTASRTLLREARSLGVAGLHTLLVGPPGCGKETLARHLHRESPRRHGPFVVLDASRLHSDLKHDLLYGHQKGSFSGAVADRDGVFAEAGGGTLYVDRAELMDAESQNLLAAFLDKGSFRPLGAERERHSDARVVLGWSFSPSGTADPESMLPALRHRLAGSTLQVPGLDGRREDIAELVLHFHGSAPEALVRELHKRPWTHHVRELRECLATFEREGTLPKSRDPVLGPLPVGLHTFAQFEREIYRQALEAAQGSRLDAAKMLAIPKSTFYRRCDELGLKSSMKSS